MRPASLLLACALLACADDIYQAPSPEPTPEETLILEFINRCRADPTADSLRIAPVGETPRLMTQQTIDFAMFRAEMAAIKPSAPLVLDLRLLDAARKHSWYMIQHGLGHDEDPAKPRFTGKSFMERAKAAGFSGNGGGENCFKDAGDPYASHVGFIVDWGPGGTGGMQPGRGHRANITNAGFNLVGPGAVPHARLSVTHVFGSDGRRYAGGVVYLDKDRDAFYSLGEGRGGVEIEIGGKKAATWGSGAYAIEVPAGGGTLTLRAGAVSITRAIAAASGNVKLDWIIPQEQDLKEADKLLAAVDAAKDPAAAAARKARVALLIGGEGLCLDDARAARVKELTGELSTALAADRAAVREAMPGEAKAFRKLCDEHAKPWKGTAAAAWFDEAETVVKAAAAAASVPADAPPTRLRGVAKELRALADKATVAEFRAKLELLARTAEGRGR